MLAEGPRFQQPLIVPTGYIELASQLTQTAKTSSKTQMVADMALPNPSTAAPASCLQNVLWH
jgi:hypothetical protein